MILSGADNRPPMLDKDLYDSWKSRMELYMQNREHRRMLLESVENGPLIWPTIEENGVTRTKVAKDLWERVQLLMQGTSLTKQERECKLYDAFDKFTHIKGESLHNKFMTDVKLVKDFHTTNFDQLHAYLEQHELYANEVRLLCERNQDPLFPPSQYGSIHSTQHYSSTHPSQPQFNHSSILPSYPYQSQMNHQTISVPQIAYQSPQVSTQPMTESPLMDLGFTVPVFSLGDDPIACLNKAMAFLTAVASLRETLLVLGETMQMDKQGLLNATTVKVKDIWLGNALSLSDQGIQHDPGVPDGQAVQTIILNNAAFQTEDLDTYDFDCDDISNAQAILMANISNYGSDVILELWIL
ncbi:hypothetical protein Tco_0575065 [Tanacetum coccineum]